jgi:hypothetical protein
MERMRGRGGVYGGGVFLISGRQIERRKKLQKYNTTKALDGCRSIFCHATTDQDHAGVTEGGWDRPRDRARTLGERDGKLRATTTTTASTARSATSPTTTTNTPLASTVSVIGSKTQQPTDSRRQR